MSVGGGVLIFNFKNTAADMPIHYVYYEHDARANVTLKMEHAQLLAGKDENVSR